MSLFRKIFGLKSDDSQEHIQSDERSKYMPDVKLPIDERFTINFKANALPERRESKERRISSINLLLAALLIFLVSKHSDHSSITCL